MSDIPPPLIPDPPPESIGEHLYLPYSMADAPRLQLDLLCRHTALPEHHRAELRKWLNGYNTIMLKWLHDTYGMEAVRAAESMSKSSAEKISYNQRKAQEKSERKLFDHLEKEMREDE